MVIFAKKGGGNFTKNVGNAFHIGQCLQYFYFLNKAFIFAEGYFCKEGYIAKHAKNIPIQKFPR